MQELNKLKAEPNADSFTPLEQAEKIEKTRSKQTEIRSIKVRNKLKSDPSMK